MPGGKRHPQKRTLLFRHLRRKRSLIAVLPQGQALSQSSSNFPLCFSAMGGKSARTLGQLRHSGCEPLLKRILLDFSRESST